MGLLFWIILKFLFFVNVTCVQKGHKNKTARITDWDLDYLTFTELEFISSVVYGRFLVCGATRIHEFWIITSGKCVDSTYNSDLLKYFGPLGIRIGTDDAEKIYAKKIMKDQYQNDSNVPIKGLAVAVDPKTILRVEKVVLHPNYGIKKITNKPITVTQYDVALVKLEKNQTFKTRFLAKLPTKPALDVTGICETYGWGADNLENTYYFEEFEDDHNHEMLGFRVKMTSDIECQNIIYNNIKKYFTSHEAVPFVVYKVCVKDVNSITLRDFGGPMICENNVLYGIIDNYIIPHEDANSLLAFPNHVASVFIDVVKYVDWITTVTGDHISSSIDPRAIPFNATVEPETNSLSYRICSDVINIASIVFVFYSLIK